MNYAQTIYQRSLQLPDSAAQEALDFIDFLLQRHAPAATTAPGHGSQPKDTAAFLLAVSGAWGDDFPDDIDDTDLGTDAARDTL